MMAASLGHLIKKINPNPSIRLIFAVNTAFTPFSFVTNRISSCAFTRYRVLYYIVKKDIRILLLEDDFKDAELIKFALDQDGLSFQLRRVDSEDQFLAQMEQLKPDIVLLDYTVPGFDGLKALSLAQQKYPDIPFIFVTGTLGEEVVIEMLKNGATDYVLKTRLSRLGSAVLRAIREAKDRLERKKAEIRLRKSLDQLRELSGYLQSVREDERIRISRQVHDELGQALTGLKMDLSWLAKRLPRDGKPVLDKIESMSGSIDTTIQTVRRISTELRPGILDDLGLVAAIEWQAQEFQQRTGIKCVVTNDLTETILDEDINTAFFRIFQETLTNIIRHANATQVDVRIEKYGHTLHMLVTDNGRGITEAEINNTQSIGLLGMQERAAILGGEVTYTGAAGQGTTVRVQIPLTRSNPSTQLINENSYRRRPRSRSPWLETNPGR
jgi:signal transduction histidine kinase